jgi:hypothetical protein
MIVDKLPPGPAFIQGPYCLYCRKAGFWHCGSGAEYCGGTPPIPGYIWQPATIGTAAGWIRGKAE